MSTTLPLVSICIPVHNGEIYIEQAIDSALQQTYANIEIIVFDNASTDDTAQKAEAHLGSQSTRPYRVVRNSGTLLSMSGSFRSAHENANGHYVKLLCHDDRLHPECVSREVEILEAHPDVSLVACRRQLCDAQGRIVFTPPKSLPKGQHSGRHVAQRCARFGRNLIGEPAVGLYRNETMRAVGNFSEDLKYYVDLDFWCRLLQSGDYYQLDEILADFRVHPGGASAQMQNQILEELPRWERHLQEQKLSANGPIERFLRRGAVWLQSVVRQRLINAACARQGR